MREADTGRSIPSLIGCCLLAFVALGFALHVEYRNWNAGAVLLIDGIVWYLLGPLTILWAGGSALRTLRDGTAAFPIYLGCLGSGIISTYLQSLTV
jgi:hypothetical protein